VAKNKSKLSTTFEIRLRDPYRIKAEGLARVWHVPIAEAIRKCIDAHPEPDEIEEHYRHKKENTGGS
jgi:hypothetical protein